MKNKLPELILAGAFIAVATFKEPIKAFTGLDMIETMASLFLTYLNCKLVLLAIQIRSATNLVAPAMLSFIVLLSSFAESIDHLTGIKTYDIIFALIFGCAGITALAQIFRMIDSFGIWTITQMAEVRYKYYFDEHYQDIDETDAEPSETLQILNRNRRLDYPRHYFLYVYADEQICDWTRVSRSVYNACYRGTRVRIKYGRGRFSNDLYIKEVYPPHF